MFNDNLWSKRHWGGGLRKLNKFSSSAFKPRSGMHSVSHMEMASVPWLNVWQAISIAVGEAVKLKKEAFRACLSQGSTEAADRYRAAKRAAGWLLKLKLGSGRNTGRLWRRTFIGLKGFLVNHLTAQKGKAGTFPGCAWPGWRTADPNWGYCRAVEGALWGSPQSR